jgi:membrane-bound lytic murein transglycosylase A
VRALQRALALLTLALLAACAAKPLPQPEAPPAAPTPAPPPLAQPTPPPPPVGPNARAVGVKTDNPRVLKADEASRALAAFKTSCPALVRRQDQSQLTQPTDWSAVCAQAASLTDEFAPGFFYYGFDWVRVGEGKAFATGYYEPEIEGSRTPLPGYVPIYRVPPDLIRCTKPDGTAGRGRVDESGTCVLYFTRAEIEDGALNGKGLELAWAKDPVELFFLEIQGSGRIHFPDGTVMRVGYAGQNGRDYIAIGRLLRDRGILPPGGANMQTIKDWIRANSDQGRELMRENMSYVFFKELTGAGPLGAPVFLTLDRNEANGLWVAQDTGGAIKGPNRFDTFWGAGPEAVAIAGGMSGSGEALILLPKGTAARAQAQP